ncbi:MAG: hypothetical protein ATN32_02020 [Candidatus Epulonipiscium fishelsonii]|nr:MAG: hypothetical protein ATN32_02020 [Epulopiscium sp. AS2M-Bin002]
MIDWDYLINYTFDKVEDECVRGGKVLYGRDLHTREIDRMLDRNEEALYLTKNNIGDTYLITTNGLLVFTRNSRREEYYDFYRDQITFLDFQNRKGRFDSDVEIVVEFNRDNNFTISIDMYYEAIAKDIFYYFKDIRERQYNNKFTNNHYNQYNDIPQGQGYNRSPEMGYNNSNDYNSNRPQGFSDRYNDNRPQGFSDRYNDNRPQRPSDRYNDNRPQRHSDRYNNYDNR